MSMTPLAGNNPEQAEHISFTAPRPNLPPTSFTHVDLEKLAADLEYVVGIARRVEAIIEELKPEDIARVKKTTQNPFLQKQLAKRFGGRDFPGDM